MRYHAVVVDYDGTLASEGRVAPRVLEAVEGLSRTGRKVILVTGRQFGDLRGAFPEVDRFDRIVAENGALLYNPSTRQERLLAKPPPEAFVHALRQRPMPLDVGKVVVATGEPHDRDVLQVIRELGLELQVIFNKGAVMVLPANVNKATGLKAALHDLGLSAHNAVAVGDAENDHAMLALCETAFAVANALPMLKEQVDHVLQHTDGEGVIELFSTVMDDDLAGLDAGCRRHEITLGRRPDGEDARLSVHRRGVLIAGQSSAGKSTLVTSIVEQLADQAYQFCLIDPGGDYEGFATIPVLGSADRAPLVGEVVDILERPDESVIVNLVAVPLADRPEFFAGLLARLQHLRAATGRPHWILVDEAHHLLPSNWRPTLQAAPREVSGLLLATVHPEKVARDIVAELDTVIGVGATAADALRVHASAARLDVPAWSEAADGQDGQRRREAEDGAQPEDGRLSPGNAVVWLRESKRPVTFEIRDPAAELQRHRPGAFRPFPFTG